MTEEEEYCLRVAYYRRQRLRRDAALWRAYYGFFQLRVLSRMVLPPEYYETCTKIKAWFDAGV